MILYTSPRGERLGLVPCREESGRVVVEVWGLPIVRKMSGSSYHGLSDLEGRDIEPDGHRSKIEPTVEIMAALRTWEGKVEES